MSRLAELAELIDPATDLGLHYYPLLKAGERFPVNDPDLAPRMEPRPAEDHHFLQALLEGMAGIEALAYQRLADAGRSRSGERPHGGRGGAECRLERGFASRKIAVPLLQARSEEAAAGTALLALGAFTIGEGTNP